MRFAKLGLISIIVFFVLLTAIASLFPSHIIVSRAVNINANKDSIAAYISTYKKWNAWMEGAKQSDLKVVAEDSNKAFFGTMIITLGAHEKYSWQHEWKGKTTTQLSTIQLITSNNIIIVQWQFEQYVKWYPWEKFGSMMNDKILGTSMEQSLDNLKKVCENK